MYTCMNSSQRIGQLLHHAMDSSQQMIMPAKYQYQINTLVSTCPHTPKSKIKYNDKYKITTQELDIITL